MEPDEAEDEWDQLLEPYSAIGSLLPALITEVRDFSASAWLFGTGLIDIEWNGMSWARRYFNENRRGRAPRNADEIVKPGDIVRVREDPEVGWRLAQIPTIEGSLVSMDPHNGATLALVGGF